MKTTTNPALQADWDDMVFVDREQGYGAYLLRKGYPRHLAWGVGAAVLLGALLIIGPWLVRSAPASHAAQATVVQVTMDNPPPPPKNPPQELLPPPPPPPPEPPKLRQMAVLIPEPTPEEELSPDDTATIHTMDSMLAAPNVGLKDVSGANRRAWMAEIGDGEGEVPEVIVEHGPPAPGDFVPVEHEPVPLNLEELRQQVGYPAMAREAHIEGTVVLRILVNAKGKYQRHKLISQAHPLLVRAVEAQIAKLHFSPAIQAGRPIAFWVNVPFAFKLID